MSRKIELLLACLLLSITLSTWEAIAQDAASQAAGAPPSMAADADTQARVQHALQHLNSELNLTDDQKDKIKPILQGEVQQMKSVRDDSSLSTDQKHAKMQGIHESAKSQISSILTPEQQQKLEAMSSEAKQHQ